MTRPDLPLLAPLKGAEQSMPWLRRTRGGTATATGEAAVSRVAQTRSLIEEVRDDGDAALLAQCRRFDGVTVESIEIDRGRWQDALQSLPDALRSAMLRAKENIARFHQAQSSPTVRVETEPGVVLERRVAPMERAGVYAPGGRAAYPSSVLMAAVPARVAGVRDVIVASPPGPDGRPHEAVLAACEIAEVDRVFAMGGAGAIAAMALGTSQVPPVDVIVGPGNAWVEEAKRQLAGQVRVDSPAGPSEVLILADDGASPKVIVRELIAQAEHDPDAVCVFVTTSRALGEDVARQLRIAVPNADRQEIVESSLCSRGALLFAESVEEMVVFGNDFAPEHLLLLSDNASTWVDQIRTAGTIFVGESSSVVFGDYMTGANHVLPTGGAARSFSGLGFDTFLRSFTVQTIEPAAAARLAADTALFADSEALLGHAAAAASWQATATAPASEGKS